MGAVLFVIIMATALLLRLHELGALSFWSDETWTAIMATADDPLAPLIKIENSPPLYYAMIMPVWARLTAADEFWLRIPSLLAGLLMIGVRIDADRDQRDAPADARTAMIPRLGLALTA